MKYLKKIFWVIGTCLVLWLILRNPQYAIDAAKAVSMIMGEKPCICDE